MVTVNRTRGSADGHPVSIGAGIPDMGWAIIAGLILAAVLAMLHTFAVLLRNEQLVHERRIEVANLRMYYIDELKRLHGIVETEEAEILDDEDLDAEPGEAAEVAGAVSGEPGADEEPESQKAAA